MIRKIWKPQRRIEIDYQKFLFVLFSKFSTEILTMKKQTLLMGVAKRFIKSKWFNDFAEGAVIGMFTKTKKDTARQWREAAKETSKGRKIYEALKKETDKDKVYQDLLKRNMFYISSVPLEMADRMSKYVAKAHIEGKRPEQIAKELQEMVPGMARSKANLIARTESAKAAAEIVQARAIKLGFQWYVWKTSEDQRVRKSHRNMNGIIAKYSDPPSPEKLSGEKDQGNYNPGNFYNCRCFASPVFDIDDINFPHRIYYNGSIQTMTKVQFKEIM
ncbi:MAG: phage minor head protein [Parabacteroides sp.]